MTNLEKLVKTEKLGIFQELKKTDPGKLREMFNIPHTNTLEEWLFAESFADLPEEVDRFIDAFTTTGNDFRSVSEMNSYWFAVILTERFRNHNTQILYDVRGKSFLAKIGDCFYDATGDKTDAIEGENPELVPWAYFTRQEPEAALRIRKRIMGTE